MDLPKQVVDSALEADCFAITFLGHEFEQVTLLMTLSGLYLLAISVSGLNKYVLNVFKGYVAERFLRRFRLLVHRQGRRDPNAGDQSEIVPLLAQEVESIGGCSDVPCSLGRDTPPFYMLDLILDTETDVRRLHTGDKAQTRAPSRIQPLVCRRLRPYSAAPAQ